jgi:hypothetical protein
VAVTGCRVSTSGMRTMYPNQVTRNWESGSRPRARKCLSSGAEVQAHKASGTELRAQGLGYFWIGKTRTDDWVRDHGLFQRAGVTAQEQCMGPGVGLKGDVSTHGTRG